MDLWEYVDLFSLWCGWFNLNHRLNQILCDNRFRFKFNAKLFPDHQSPNFSHFCVSVMPLVSSRLSSLTLTKHYTSEFVRTCGQLKFDRLKVLIVDETHAVGNTRGSNTSRDVLFFIWNRFLCEQVRADTTIYSQFEIIKKIGFCYSNERCNEIYTFEKRYLRKSVTSINNIYIAKRIF
jgi:hypothetical protein